MHLPVRTDASCSSVPKNYVPALEFFVAAKRELIERGISSFIPAHHATAGASSSSHVTEQENEELAVMNDHQLKFVHALTKQILRETGSEGADKARSSSSKKTHVTLQPPKNVKFPLARQGPFLLQPAPPELADGLEEEPEACDIVYIEVGAKEDSQNSDRSTDTEVEKLGVVAIVYQDGRVDLCLDTEKVEARWDVNVSAAPLFVTRKLTFYYCSPSPQQGRKQLQWTCRASLSTRASTLA